MAAIRVFRAFGVSVVRLFVGWVGWGGSGFGCQFFLFFPWASGYEFSGFGFRAFSLSLLP